MSDNATINSATRLVKPGAPGEDTVYPVYLSQVKAENPDWSFPDTPLVEFINTLGYFVVEDADKPESTTQIVVEGTPVEDNGVWKQNWIVRDYTAEEEATELTLRKLRLNDDIAKKTSDALDIGFLFDFGDGKPAGHVQLRDGDRANVTGIRVRADAMIKAGNTDPLPFRDYENVIHFTTPEKIVEMSDKAYVSYQQYLAIGWTLKDQVTVAEHLADLPTVPDVFELPQ